MGANELLCKLNLVNVVVVNIINRDPMKCNMLFSPTTKANIFYHFSLETASHKTGSKI